MDKVEENVRADYLVMGIYENLVNTGLQELIKANPTIRFIGEPYAVDQKKDKDNTVITLKLDIFPEVEVVNEDWKKHSLKKIDTAVKQEDIDEAMLRLKKNYADYKDTDTIALDTVAKIALSYLAKDGTEIDK
jgi:FKBP-type peptidyl-prolyl cis-trans isomerase (trigger factor)